MSRCHHGMTMFEEVLCLNGQSHLFTDDYLCVTEVSKDEFDVELDRTPVNKILSDANSRLLKESGIVHLLRIRSELW